MIGNQEERRLEWKEPEVCYTCGLKTAEWYEEHPDNDEHWLLIPIVEPGSGKPFPTIAMFVCPKCGTISANGNYKENQAKLKAWIKEDQDRRIAVSSGLVDPAGRPLDLRKVG